MTSPLREHGSSAESLASAPTTGEGEPESNMSRQANKGILIDRLARELGVPARAAGEMLDAVLDSWSDLLRAHGKLALKGFGTFERRQRKGRRYRHPLTGASIAVPDRETIQFRPSPQLLDAIGDPGHPAA